MTRDTHLFELYKKDNVEKQFKILSDEFDKTINTMQPNGNNSYFFHLKGIMERLIINQNREKLREAKDDITKKTAGERRELSVKEVSELSRLDALIEGVTYEIIFNPYASDEQQKVPGVLYPNRIGAIVMHINKSPIDRRVIKAHELGHLWIHPVYETEGDLYPFRNSIGDKLKINKRYTETQAFYFAKLLMTHRDKVYVNNRSYFPSENSTYGPSHIHKTIVALSDDYDEGLI